MHIGWEIFGERSSSTKAGSASRVTFSLSQTDLAGSQCRLNRDHPQASPTSSPTVGACAKSSRLEAAQQDLTQEDHSHRADPNITSLLLPCFARMPRYAVLVICFAML